jgi:hypothetical protein
MGVNPMALLGQEGAQKDYYYYYLCDQRTAVLPAKSLFPADAVPV